jgi:hypothetical protein
MALSTSQGTPTGGSGGGARPAPAGQPETLDQINASIADRDKELKQLQQELADLNARKTARAAFDQEQTTGGKAIETLLGKVAAAMEQAGEMIGQADKVASNVPDEHVQGIKDAVDRVDEQTATLRDALATSFDAVLEKSGLESTAKAESANARAKTAEWKRRLLERTRAIDLEITRISGLITEARTTIAQRQYTTALLLITDLQSGAERLNDLADPDGIAELQHSVSAAWEAEQDAGIKERAATWDLNKAKEAQQVAQANLTTNESNRRADLNNAVQALGSDRSTPERGGTPPPSDLPEAQASPPIEAVAVPDEYGQEYE